jgi:protein involved in polysaccharide export with SLBB domain
MRIIQRFPAIAAALVLQSAWLLAQTTPQQPTAVTDDKAAAQPPMPGRASDSDGGRPRQVISSAEGDYVLSPGDMVELSIFREPDLTSHSMIARDGTVQLPLLREVKLAGMTVREARDMLAKLYGQKYLVNPQVYLNVVQFAQRKFTIMGQIAKPGSYDLQGGQTIDLLEAIGMAGGFTRIADRGRVLIRRKTSDSGSEIIKANAKRMAEGKIEIIDIKPGDVITIGESWY